MAAALADELGLQIGKAAVVRPRLSGDRGAARVVGEGGASGCLIFIWALLTPARPRPALEIHGTRIRLWGIDAPESSQLCRGEDRLQYRCGAKAAKECLPISLDRYRRTVATCLVGGADLGDWLVRNGLALDWPQYSKRKYDDPQREA
jgi:hypothetical protein